MVYWLGALITNVSSKYRSVLLESFHLVHITLTLNRGLNTQINNLFDLNCLKFIYDYNKRILPNYFLDFRYEQRSSIHDHDTTFADLIDAEPTPTVMAEHCIRHHIVTLLNCTPRCILDKIATQSLQGFTFYIKRYYLNQMSYECLRQCYVCNMHSRWWPWPDNDFTETR